MLPGKGAKGLAARGGPTFFSKSSILASVSTSCSVGCGAILATVENCE